MLAATILLVSVSCCHGRDIVFPEKQPLQYAFSSSRDLDDITISGHQFNGLTTFANLPYVDCFADGDIEEQFDIAFLGAPFDTLNIDYLCDDKGVTARPGARYGPTGIRLGSRRISPEAYYDLTTDNNPFKEWAKVVDCGNPSLTFLDNTVALKQLEKAHKVVASRGPNTTSSTHVPRIITLGGDHTTTLAALRSTYGRWGGQVSVIHFDSHIDTWDPEVLGGGVSHYAGVNHGTFLHIAHEEGLISKQSIHAGIRAPVVRPKADRRNDLRCGFDVIRARDIDKIGVQGIIERLRNRVRGTKVYVSVDIDVLDPAFAPATGTAEVGGWTTRELLSILEGLSGIPVIGADVVEVTPIYDNPGETTVLAAADVAVALLQLMVQSPEDAVEIRNTYQAYNTRGLR